MLWKSSAFLPQVSADGHYQRQDSWLTGPSQLCVLFVSQNQTRVVYRSQMAFILMGLWWNLSLRALKCYNQHKGIVNRNINMQFMEF